MHRIQFTVYGRPVPQGSMIASYNTKDKVARVHHVQGAALAQWRASIRLAAIEAGAQVLEGAVQIVVVFGMVRPIRKAQYPTVAPDLDKLVRALLDALTNVCYNDDAQVVSLYAGKVYSTRTEVIVKTYADASEYETTARLGEATKSDTSERQLSLSSMWETGGE